MFQDTKPQVQSRGATVNTKAQEHTKDASEKILKDISPKLEVNKFSNGSISASFKNTSRGLDFVPNVDKSHGPILECKFDPDSIKVSGDGKTAPKNIFSVSYHNSQKNVHQQTLICLNLLESLDSVHLRLCQIDRKMHLEA